jgi:hypothetical protein
MTSSSAFDIFSVNFPVFLLSLSTLLMGATPALRPTHLITHTTLACGSISSDQLYASGLRAEGAKVGMLMALILGFSPYLRISQLYRIIRPEISASFAAMVFAKHSVTWYQEAVVGDDGED